MPHSNKRMLMVAAAFAVILVATAAGWLFTQLDRAQASLQATEAQLQQESASLTDTRNDLRSTITLLNDTLSALTQTKGALVEERLTRNQLQQDKAALTADKAILLQEKAALTISLDTATANNVILAADLAAALATNVSLTTDLAAAETHTTQLTADLTAAEVRETGLAVALQSAHDRNLVLTNTNIQLRADYQTLETMAGTVDQLRQQTENLETEIADLEERRKPLILGPRNTAVREFACTGSMEPAITCLDKATWLYDYDAADIVPGTTISFRETACDKGSPREPFQIRIGTRYIAHRVLDVRVVNDELQFWPKGDNNYAPDGCWVPASGVRGYLIELHQGVVPENATLRAGFNAARTNYLELRIAHGCPRNPAHTCYLQSPSFEIVSAAYYGYECWLTNVLTSQYPGHIPNSNCPPPST